MSVFNKSRSAARRLIFISLIVLAGVGVCYSTARSAEKDIVNALAPSTSPMPQLSLVSARFFTINQVLARHDGRSPETSPAARLVAVDPRETIIDTSASSVRQMERRDEPFGLLTFRAPEGSLWVKWRKVQSEIDADAHVILDCRADPDQCSSPAALRFLALVDQARNMPTRIGIGTINRSINGSIRYVSDLRQHGVLDLWSSPLATLTSGQGDCEDYAIAKYMALRQLGMGEDDLRLLLVRDRAVGQDHAVLGVRHEDHWLILDNRHSYLLGVAELPQFTPLFSIDQQGVKMFAASYAGMPSQHEADMAPAAQGDYW